VKNLCLVAASILLSLVIGELALRVAYPNEFPRTSLLDPLLGWRPWPGAEGWHAGEGDAFVSINSEGFRDVEHSIEKSAGTYRIAVIGDSMTEGREVMLEETYWKRLESLLHACPALADKKIEMLSYGVNGYGTPQEYLALKTYALRHHPDLVLLAFFSGNNLTKNSKALGGHRDRPYFALVGGELKLVQTAGDAPDFARRRWWDGVVYRYFEPLRLYELGKDADSRIRTMIRYGFRTQSSGIESIGLDSDVYHAPATEAWKDTWAVTEAIILAIRGEAVNHGAAFVMTTLTNPIQDAPDLAARARFQKAIGVADLTYPDRRLAAFAAAHGFPDIPLVATLPAYAAEHHAALHGPTDGNPIGHYNRLGHELAAKAIAAGLCLHLGNAQASSPLGSGSARTP
jgi:hypothetical protein